MARLRRTILSLAAAMALPVLCGTTVAAADPPRGGPIQQQHTAQEVQVEVTADSDTIRVSDSLRLTLRVTFPPTCQVQFPSLQSGKDAAVKPGEMKLGDFTLSAVLDESPLASGTPETPRTTLTRRLTLEPFLPGSYTIPELLVTWRKLDGSAQGVVRTTPLSIAVASVLPTSPATQGQAAPNLDPGDIRPAIESEVARSNLMLFISVGTAITCAIIFGVGMRRRVLDPDPLKDLEAVLASWPHDGADRPECSLMDALVRCGRGALADRLDPDAAACSGSELHRILPKAHGDASMTRLIAIIEQLDVLRFSGSQLTQDDRRQHLADVLGAVRQLRTRPRVKRGGGS